MIGGTMKVLVATEKPFAKEAVDKNRRRLPGSRLRDGSAGKYPSKDDLLLAVKDADAMIVRSDIVDADVLAAGKQLKLVVRAAPDTTPSTSPPPKSATLWWKTPPAKTPTPWRSWFWA
jgi:phosphoglycerate dehydrogenase-like enzyme